MSEDSQPAGDVARPPRRRPVWVSQFVLPVAVAVVGTLLITALTPLGKSVRELLFPTRATVSGSVLVAGKPAVAAHLKLDGADSVNTDAGGQFVLTSVGRGRHSLHLELAGAKPRDKVFTVASGQTALQVGTVEMEPLVRLGYVASVQPQSFSQQVSYDVTVWIIGDSGVLSRIGSVSYTLPAPLPAGPVGGASAKQAFCYRQVGNLSFQDLSVVGGAFALASATVDLGGGKSFQISAPPGKTRPPSCHAHQAGPDGKPGPGPSPGPQPPPSPGPGPVPSSTGTTPQEITVPNVIGLSEQSAQASLQRAGFKVSVQTVVGPSSIAPGDVWQQNPNANTTVTPGTTVTMLVQPAVSTSATPTPTSSRKGTS